MTPDTPKGKKVAEAYDTNILPMSSSYFADQRNKRNNFYEGTQVITYAQGGKLTQNNSFDQTRAKDYTKKSSTIFQRPETFTTGFYGYNKYQFKNGLT